MEDELEYLDRVLAEDAKRCTRCRLECAAYVYHCYWSDDGYCDQPYSGCHFYVVYPRVMQQLRALKLD